MFKKDRYSIFLFTALALLVNPSHPKFGIDDDWLTLILLILVIPLMVTLLFFNKKLKRNKFFTVLLKGIKISFFGYVLFSILNVLISTDYHGEVRNIADSFVQQIPRMIVRIILTSIPVFLSVIISSLIAFLLRKKYRPTKKKVEEHLLNL